MQKFCVTVDYTKNPAELISNSKFDINNLNDIPADTNYLIYGSTPIQVDIELFTIKEPSETEPLLKQIEFEGYRPATIEEFLTLAATYPNLQKESPIVCLGYQKNFVTLDGNGFPFIMANTPEDIASGYPEGRVFDIVSSEDGIIWNPSVRFAVVQNTFQ